MSDSVVLMDSVADCLLELDLQSFTVELLSEAPEVVDELGSGDTNNSYTVFGLSDEELESRDLPVGLLGHVLNRTVESKHLTDGRVLQTLVPEVFLHIRKSSSLSSKVL